MGVSQSLTVKRPARIKPVHHAADFKLDIHSGDDDLFRWFLLAYLLGKPIQSTVAVKTWKILLQSKMDLPWALFQLPDRQLAGLLHQGGYTRYQHVTTRALKKCMQQLINFYDGSISLMIAESQTQEELSHRLQKLYGVGPKTAEIFMRETEEIFARRAE